MRSPVFSQSRSPILLLALTALCGCSKSGTPNTDTANAAAQPAPAAAAPAPIALSSVAGTWNGSSTPASGSDTTTTHYVLKATADTTGWTITYPNGKPIPMHVRPDADSLIFDVGPYKSVRVKGVEVTVHSVSRLQDGKLVGTAIAHYRLPKGDSTLTLHTEAVRAP